MRGQPVLSVRNLNKIYDNGTHALKDISFDVYEGEFLVVIGLSGSGKSTLLKCLNRLLRPTSGEVFFEGRRIDNLEGKLAQSVRRQIAMIFQSFNLVPRLTVMVNVLCGRLAMVPTWRSLLGLYSVEDRQIASKYLRLVGILDKADTRADQLSGGQQQRVAIARALTQNPKILLADEPVASLDPATCHTIMDYLRKAQNDLGVTVVCNLHFLSLVREYATRVIALRDGRLVYEGRPEDINEAWFKTIYGESARDIQVN